MAETLQKLFKGTITAILVFQLAGCGTLLYPERRGQIPGRLDVGIVLLDAIGLLFFLIPGVIAFAVDFSDGCIYLPATRRVVTTADLIKIKFDPRHTSLAQIEKIIKDHTGCAVQLTQGNMRIIRMRSIQEVVGRLAAVSPHEETRLALLHAREGGGI